MSPTRIAKTLCFGICLVLVSPLVVVAWLEERLSSSEALFTLFAQMLAPAPGLPGAFLRGAYYFGTLRSCSWETHVGFGSIFTHRGASMARHASMGAYCVMGHAQIGEGVMIGSRVSIPSGKRQHLDADGRVSGGEGRYERVTIGAGTWVGEGAIVLADVGQRCIVSAGAVVTHPVPDDCLVGGNPARVLRPASTPSAHGPEG